MSFEAKKKSRRKDSEMAKAMKDVGAEPTTRLNVEIPESMMKQLKIVVALKDTTIKEYLNTILKEQLLSENQS